MSIDRNVKDIFKTASLHARAGIDSEKLTFDGLQLAVGNLIACQALVNFNNFYNEAHGSYSTRGEIGTQILLSASEPQEFSEQLHLIREAEKKYQTRRNKVWNRYALREVYRFEKRQEQDFHHIAQENKLKRYQHSCHFAPEVSHHQEQTHRYD
jgi:hypothetical protein